MPITKTNHPESLSYFQKEGLDRYFTPVSAYSYGAHNYISQDPHPVPPDLDDLVRLHRLIRKRCVLTILEFGVGFSTVVMADALAKNKADYEAECTAQDIRCLHPFQIFSVDASADWIANTRKTYFPTPDLSRCGGMEHEKLQPVGSLVHFIHSDVRIGTFNDRLCYYYSSLPDITPDFIYLDAPGGDQVQGSLDGSSFAGNLERTVISADLLRLEPTLAPGTFILVDGRTNNARFLKNNFQREWKVTHDAEADVTAFELIEPPLGIHNEKRLKFQKLLNY